MTLHSRPLRPRLAFSADRSLAPEPCLTPAQADRFALEVMPHLDAAYRFARYLARDAGAAEDIVQNAYIRAFRAFAAFEGRAPKAWLLAIVRNCVFDWAKTNSATILRDSLEDVGEVDPDTPETILLRKRQAMMVRDAVAGLPEPFRETLVLRELEEMSYKEIASLTRTPVGTVMSRLARARDMLGKLLPAGGHTQRGGS